MVNAMWAANARSSGPIGHAGEPQPFEQGLVTGELGAGMHPLPDRGKGSGARHCRVDARRWPPVVGVRVPRTPPPVLASRDRMSSGRPSRNVPPVLQTIGRSAMGEPSNDLRRRRCASAASGRFEPADVDLAGSGEGSAAAVAPVLRQPRTRPAAVLQRRRFDAAMPPFGCANAADGAVHPALRPRRQPGACQRYRDASAPLALTGSSPSALCASLKKAARSAGDSGARTSACKAWTTGRLATSSLLPLGVRCS